MKIFPIHLSNGATVCTPDDIALEARVNRCKRVLRHNVGLHSQALKTARKEADKRLTTREKVIDGVLGSVLGVFCFVAPFYFFL